ncbi:MAG TPA: LCP family protein [Solirubrobacteraceae bacterium]|jgi:LCP family protein required for cell wall assembly|nr:LCP family protein [Solirubrobacteraceae bacterium]
MIPRTRMGMAWRFVLCGVLLISAAAATTAVAGLLQVSNLVHDIGVTPAIQSNQIQLPAPGKPQTILIIGSDHRAGEPFRAANTDTMLLVRLNSSSSTINVLSIPRDLQVTIPGFGDAKINSAYEDGGPNLLIKTIRANVFPDLKVNHIVDVNFGGFTQLVNAIGCVYSDVDHRYYNNTLYTNYSSIDVEPGYQKLCGTHALEFVRFRHTDSDITRNARQQDFIRWAKDQYGIARLFNNRDRLLRIFGKHAQTDKVLHSTDGLIDLFNLVLNSDGNTIRQFTFPAVFGSCDSGATTGTTAACFVTASSTAEHDVFARFMTPTRKPKATPKTPVPAPSKISTATKRKLSKGSKIDINGLVSNPTAGQAQAAALTKLKMPIYYPRLLKAGSEYCVGIASNCPVGEGAGTGYYPREYVIRDQHGKPYPSYRMTVEINPVLGQYYGVQGTMWGKPPLLASPSGTKVVSGKRLFFFADGGRLTTVAWRGPQGGWYWISNTLQSTIPNSQMVGMAASFTLATR